MQIVIHLWNKEKTKQWEQNESHLIRNQETHAANPGPDSEQHSAYSESSSDEDL